MRAFVINYTFPPEIWLGMVERLSLLNGYASSDSSLRQGTRLIAIKRLSAPNSDTDKPYLAQMAGARENEISLRVLRPTFGAEFLSLRASFFAGAATRS